MWIVYKEKIKFVDLVELLNMVKKKLILQYVGCLPGWSERPGKPVNQRFSAILFLDAPVVFLYNEKAVLRFCMTWFSIE